MSGELDPNVLIGGLLTSVPATIAACAAWRSSRRTNKKINTNNGRSPGQYIEDTHAEVVALKDVVAEHTARDDRGFAYLGVPQEVLDGDPVAVIRAVKAEAAGDTSPSS